MHILVCGARGFVGRHITAALLAHGHTVRRGIHHGPTQAGDVVLDYTRDTTPQVWLPRLKGVHAVINAVGVLRHRAMSAIHQHTPAALFQACADSGVRRVIQISALGIDNAVQSAQNPYASTKLAAQQRLLQLTAQGALDGCVLQPSIVFGAGGASSRLFLSLARSPLLLLPRPVLHAPVQPVAVEELAEVVARLVSEPRNGALACVGPQALTLAEFIASLRQQLQRPPARVYPLPQALTQLSAWAADCVPLTPWGQQALALLAQPNTADPQPFAQVLGRAATHHSQLLQRTTP